MLRCQGALFHILTWPVVHGNILFSFHHCDPQRLWSIPPERQQAFFVHTNIKRYICLLVPHVVSSHLMDLAVATFESGEKSSTIKLVFFSRRVLAAPALLLLDHPANQLKSLVLNSGISYHATIQKISLTLTFHWDAPVCLLNPSVQTPKSQLLKLVSPLCSLHNWWIRRVMSRKKFMGTLRQASQVSEGDMLSIIGRERSQPFLSFRQPNFRQLMPEETNLASCVLLNISNPAPHTNCQQQLSGATCLADTWVLLHTQHLPSLRPF